MGRNTNPEGGFLCDMGIDSKPSSRQRRRYHALLAMPRLPLMTRLFGQDFAPAAPPFRILCIGLGFVFAIWVLHAVAISVNRERLLLTTGIIGLVVNVAVNLYLIPYYGANGAAIATVTGEAVSLVVLVAGLWSHV